MTTVTVSYDVESGERAETYRHSPKGWEKILTGTVKRARHKIDFLLNTSFRTKYLYSCIKLIVCYQENHLHL